MVKSGAKWRKECLEMLMGEFQHNLDAKGRLFMPVKLREALGTSFVLTKGWTVAYSFTIWSSGGFWRLSSILCR